jgi:hypothetical protein
MSYDLTGEKISFTYGRVVQVVSGSYYDGFGNPLPIGTSSVVLTGSVNGFATTGSNTFIGNQTISGSVVVTNGITGSLQGTSSYSNTSNSSSYALTASYALNGFSLTTGSTYPITSSWANNVISASYSLTSSYAFNSQLLNNTSSTAFATTGSNNFIGTNNFTGSVNISGSTTQIGNNNLLGNTVLSGSLIVSGSFPTPTPSIKIYGDVEHYGYIRLDPVTTNIDQTISASYIYVSGSTNDLYFSQNGGGFNNTTRLRWLESNLYTGILYGGTLSSTPGSTTFNISSGSGMIVAMNATVGNDPYPTIKVVSWPDINNIPITYKDTDKISYISIDNTGSVVQQIDAWGTSDISEWDDKIVLGTVLHLSGSVSSGVFNSPQISYGYPQKSDDFTRAFGPLKISGHTLQASGSTLGIIKTGGRSFREGAGYTVNPNHPSVVIENDINTSKIYRYHLSGSTPIIDTGITNAGYTVLDNKKYVNITTGQLVTIPGGGNNQFTIQRVFWVPNSPTNAFIVYYGNAVYASLLEAKNAIDTEPFNEAPNTALNAIFVAYVIMEADATNLTTTGKSAIIQGGLFRSVGGVGASGVPSIATTLASLSDVSITSPSYGDLLMYDATYWYNTKTLSGSYILTGSLTTNDGIKAVSITASNINAPNITGSLFGTSSWSNNVVSSSYALTASYALNGGGGGMSLVTGSTYPITSSWSNNTVSASYAITASYALNSLSASYCVNPFPISGSLGYWGSFWDTTTQTNASSSNVMRLNNTDGDSNGVRITSGSKITFDHDGIYNLQFSAVFTSDNASSNDVNVWFNKNGSTLSDSNTILTIAGQSNAVAAWNYVLKLYSNDFIELYWSSPESTMKIEYSPSQSAIIPATPSLIVTATQVTNTQIAASSSYAATASYALNSGTTLTTGSIYPITSSWSNNSLTASYYGGSVTSASYSLSASYAPTNNNLTASYAILASVSMSLNFVDDAAAAAGGVPLGGLYRNGNFILIRLT